MEKNGEIRLGTTPPEGISLSKEHAKEAEEKLEDHVTKRLADKVVETLAASKDE
jgi:hypothetical protein